MIINLIKVAKISIPALRITPSLKIYRDVNTAKELQRNTRACFCSGKDKDKGNHCQKLEQHEKSDDHKQEPRVIQVSKQQYAGMRKFLEDIKMSMPMPDISPFISSSSSSSNKPNNSDPYSQINPQSLKHIDMPETATSNYFTNPQQILSFKLLKLSTPNQFLPIFQQNNKQTTSLSIKLIILHRYCSVGGEVHASLNQGPVSKTEQLAYKFMEEILNKMGQLDQKELQEFLQLYIGLRYKDKNKQQSQLKNNKFNNKKLLPSLNIQDISEQSLPLTKQPSHSNTQILILLLQLYDHQFGNSFQKISKSGRQNMIKILKHYELRTNQANNNSKEQIEYPSFHDYDMKNLAYIGIHAWALGLQQYSASKILRVGLQKIVDSSDKSQDSLYKTVKACECLLQNIHKVPAVASATTLQSITHVRQMLVTILSTLSLQPVVQSTQQSDEQSVLLASPSAYSSSSTLFSILHQCLLTLQSWPSSNTVSSFTVPILSSIFNRLNQLSQSQTSPIKILPLQYCELWQSVMLMYKATKNNAKYCTWDQMYGLLDRYIDKCEIKEWALVAEGGTEDDKIIQEDVREVQRISFQCLVGYRVLLGQNDKAVNVDKYLNLKRQTMGNSSIKQNQRKILTDLLTVYRKTVSTMYNSHLIHSASCPQIHNIAIALMISQAYPISTPPSTTTTTTTPHSVSTEQTSSYLLLSPTLIQMLKQLGVKHEKYGAYVDKVLHKYALL